MGRVATMMFKQEDNGPDLGRLNESERRVLYLLAEGHTAKTVEDGSRCDDVHFADHGSWGGRDLGATAPGR